MDKILLVEDETELAATITDWLSEDYQVDAVADGEAALAALERNKYDILVLDWMLPGISGIEICQSYRNTGGRAAVLILTAKKALFSRDLAMAAGADDFLSKPFQLRGLSSRIKALNKQVDFQAELFGNCCDHLPAGDLMK